MSLRIQFDEDDLRPLVRFTEDTDNAAEAPTT
jgi:hypothetical protein